MAINEGARKDFFSKYFPLIFVNIYFLVFFLLTKDITNLLVDFYFFAFTFVFFPFAYLTKNVINNKGLVGILNILAYLTFVLAYMYYFFDESFDFIFKYWYIIIVYCLYSLSLIINYIMGFSDRIKFYLSLNSLTILIFGIFIYVLEVYLDIMQKHFFVAVFIFISIRVFFILRDYYSVGVLLVGNSSVENEKR